MPQIILASSSKYRQALLQRLGVEFEVASPEIDESPYDNESPRELVIRLSRQKCEKIAEQYHDALIIGSDQVATLGDTILTKPGDAKNAMIQLQMIRDKTVIFITGLALWIPQNAETDVTSVDYKVHFRDYSDEEITRYLQIEQPYDCAGSFKSEQLGISMVQAMEGDDPTALMGLPLITLSKLLRDQGLSVP